ncbi:MAG: protein kinase domain-containing protein [Gemmatimonadales bacterium]
MHCGRATPTDPGVPPRTMHTGEFEVTKVRRVLADRYKVERVIGEGGMATVYLAEDLKHKRKVAVKVMRPELAATLGSDRFLREVEIAANLSHPHILPMYDSGEADGILYYVMPWVEGESLSARLKRDGELPAPEALRIAREVADALAYAHKRGIIHRDIKPANILLGDGHALVADFGIARALEAQGEAITRTGLAIGTPQYMSPEQATGGKDVDARTDIYALGAVLYEMLTGEPPFTGRSPQAVVARALTENPRSLTLARQGLPAGLDAVVMRALAKRPVDRQPTAAMLVDELSGVEYTARSGSHAAVTAGTAPASSEARRGGGLWLALGGVVMAALVAVAFFAGRWGLPGWSLWLALGLFAAGSGMLWLTSQAERRRHHGSAARRLDRWFTWRNAALGGVAALVIWSVASGAAASKRQAATGAGSRMAVLPFANLGDAADAYFADGIADEVRGKLARVHGLIVTASTSTRQYRETAKSPQEIARELGVDYLLVGRVRWAGSEGARRVQVIPEVIDARTGAVTWQQTYDADLTDVFRVQGDIATRVASAIGVALGSAEQQELAERPTTNLAAYDAYLKGKAIVGRDPASLRRAVAFLEEAVRLDSAFVQAWGLMSQQLAGLYVNGEPSSAIAERTRAAAERAMVLAPDRPEGHAARAMYHFLVRRNPELANEEIQLALRIAPNDAELLQIAGNLERGLGRWDESLSHLQQAWRLDPRSARTASRLQETLLWMRRHGEAQVQSEAALLLAPDDLRINQDRAMLYLARGDLPGARAAIRQVPPTVPAATLVVYFGNYWDLYWVLDDAQQRLLLSLGPDAFDGDRSSWAAVLAQTAWVRGDTATARRHAVVALTEQDRVLADVPDDAQRLAFRGLMLAFLGRKAEAMAAGLRSVELAPIERDGTTGPYHLHVLARTYVALGETSQALDVLERLLKVPYFVSPGWLRVDPTWDPLRGNPRFERLVTGG